MNKSEQTISLYYGLTSVNLLLILQYLERQRLDNLSTLLTIHLRLISTGIGGNCLCNPLSRLN